jgi:hypothetical protein
MKHVIREDKAVSEIIGAILLFAIASVLLTSFILWYVPSTGTNNDISYQSGTQNAFSSLDSKILSSSLTPGSSVSQSFPVGISGTPPFTPSQSTNLHYSNNFNATLNYNMEVNYTNLITTKAVSIAASANASTSNIINNNYVDSKFSYAVNFQEKGLPIGYYWTVTVGGTQKSASPICADHASIISFSLSRGTYSYSVTSDFTSDHPSPSVGTVKVTEQESTIPITFSNSSIQSVVAGCFGPTKDANSINSQNFINLVTQTGICDITYHDYWLNNSALSNNTGNFYPLASQQFFAYQANTPVSYLKFYVEPNMVYSEQTYEGGANVLASISEKPFGTSLTGSVVCKAINHTSGSSYTSGGLLENLSFPKTVCLNTNGTTQIYYLNFWEQVNESSASPNNSTAQGALNFENTSSGYGYGPNEFIGTITNAPTSANSGVSCYYEAIVNACAKSGSKQGKGNPHNTGYPTDFHISSERLTASYSSYFYLLGYNNNTSSSSSLYITETGLNSSSINDTPWQIYIGETLYQSNNSSLEIPKLPAEELNYTVENYGKYISNPESGFISILSSKNNFLNISFFEPVGSLPSFWAISDKGTQSFHLTNSTKVNFISLYLFNYTIPPGYGTGTTPTNYVSIVVCKEANGPIITPIIVNVKQTGWEQIFLTSNITDHKAITLSPGTYNISIGDVNKQGETSFDGSIGWGFATMGGYSNYLQQITTDSMDSEVNISTNSVVTPYNANSPGSLSVTNQSYMFTIGYYNVTVSSTVVPFPISGRVEVVGSINSEGLTQFTLQETEVMQDGIIITAGTGVTYVTVNPLPIRIVGSSKGISLSSIAYNMSILKGISSSVSGTGSSIVSMTMTKSTQVNYTVGNSYTFVNKLGSVKSITLYNYSYIIHSTYSKYWADTMFTELLGAGSSQNYASFSLFHDFNFKLSGDTESVLKTGAPLSLYSVNLKTVDFLLNSI